MPKFYIDEDGNELDQDSLVIEQVIDGEVSEVSVKDLLAQAQKAGAADARLRDAAEAKRAAEALLADHKNKLALADDVMAAFSGDQDALRRVAKHNKLAGSDEELDAMIEDLQNKLSGGSGGGGSGGAPLNPASVKRAQLLERLASAMESRNLDPDQLIGGVTASLGTQGNQMLVDAIIKQAATVPSLRGLLKNPKAKDKFINSVKRDLQGRRDSRGQLSTEALRDAVQETAALISEFAPGESSLNSVSVGGMPVIDESLSGHLKKGPPLKRPKMDGSDSYEEYVQRRLVQRLQEKTGEAADL